MYESAKLKYFLKQKNTREFLTLVDITFQKFLMGRLAEAKGKKQNSNYNKCNQIKSYQIKTTNLQ